MNGETDLTILLRSMQPKLHAEVYVFVTTTEIFDPQILKPRLQFIEEEGMTLIITKSAAESAGLDYSFPCRMITLQIHSSLEAAGFMAAIATHLAKSAIGVNPVSGYFHDHLFVSVKQAGDAMAELDALINPQK